MRTALRFILCAIPGAFLVLIAAPGLIAPSLGSTWPRWALVLAGIAAIPIGSALILYGTNRWGKWLYILPFIGVVAFLIAFDMPKVDGFILFLLLVLPFVLAGAVHQYYRKHP